ncbi:DUF6157 family protein [Cohnella rhizosphaerae]|uniref:DUF6157 family protein n=1 Tax=Cohnella rhizosphaerae TaxID=1457232 RepID=A0A9X4QT86_9BACL|nr:DUF6157 family protein [Cohnella rhizosphaerae]MDG0809352.1 DUF6157 family protein [Cohnella rhizosphaerae]
MEWNYYNTFIAVSDDCPVEYGAVPPDKAAGKTKPGIEYDMIAGEPYAHTQEEILYETYVRHKQLSPEERQAREAEMRAEFYGKPKACMRASMLPKKYGWGLHFNAEGKVALVPKESEDYGRFADGEVEGVKVLKAMRNKKA